VLADTSVDFYPEIPVVDIGRQGIKTFRLKSKELAHAHSIAAQFSPTSVIHNEVFDLTCCFGYTGSGTVSLVRAYLEFTLRNHACALQTRLHV